jgi:hypothetical protein
MRLVLSLLSVFTLFQSVHAEIVVDFESFALSGVGYFNGPTSNAVATPGPFGGTDRVGTFAVNDVEFSNSNNDLFGSWDGFSVSNHTDTTTPGFGNQYSSRAGSGASSSSKYAVAYNSGYFNLSSDTRLSSVAVTNTTYAALSMQNGDMFAKKFGGLSGNDGDFFRVTFNGFDGLSGVGNSVGAVAVDLADFTFTDNTEDYILSNWLTVDLSSIASARSVVLDFSSSDSSGGFINTPTYVALDNLTLTAVPEPGSLALLGIVGSGAAMCRKRKKIRVKDRSTHD